jgi:phage gpG-like protein
MDRRSLEETLRGQYRQLIRAKVRVPSTIATLALRHFKRSFQQEGFTDRSFVRWPEVNRRKSGHPQYQPRQQQKILVGKASPGISATLRVSSRTFEKVAIASFGKRYAQYHNEGVPGRLPERKFMGHSEVLFREVDKHIKQQFDKTFKV